LKIGIWTDSHNFPNLAAMKLSAYHKAQGDTVELLNHLNTYDIAYCCKVFDFTPDAEDMALISADKIIRAGTGYHDYTTVLSPEIEHLYPDYSLYPQYKQAYGYLTRGCPRACPFCIVAPKEGRQSIHVADLSEFWHGQKEIKLLDPNLLACREHEQLLQQLVDSKAWVDFTQGLDVRMLTDANCDLISKIKVKTIHFAWDNPNDDLIKQFEFFKARTVLDWRKLRVYVLANYWSSHEQDLERVYKLRELGFDPYVMIYDKEHAPRLTKQVARWVNNKFIFRECAQFEDYNPTKG
jgi:hypothetical protein